MTTTNAKHQRRQQRGVREIIRKRIGYNTILFLVHVTIALIYSSILETTDAFRISSVKQQMGWSISRSTTATTPAASANQQIDPTRIRGLSFSSSSLHVISSPRRRTSSSNKNVNIELENKLRINVKQKKGWYDSHIKTPVSTPTPVSPLLSTATSSIFQLLSSHTEKTSIRQASSAASAFKSSLFRRQQSSTSEQHQLFKGNNYYFDPSLTKTTNAASSIQRNSNTDTSGRRTRTQEQTRKQKRTSSETHTTTEVTTIEELNRYWPRCLEDGEDDTCLLSEDESVDPSRPLPNYNELLRGISVKGDTQIIGSKDHPDFVHPVVRLMHERKRQRTESVEESMPVEGTSSKPTKKKDKIALVVEGGGMRGCVSAGMICAIHCLGLSDTIDVVYGSSAGSIIAAYFVSKQLPYFGPEVYYDSLTTMENPTRNKPKHAAAASDSASSHNGSRSIKNQQPNHVVDRYLNDYFIDMKRMTRSMGLGLCDPRLLKDVCTRRVHGKPMMNLHYFFENIMIKKKPLDYETFVERQAVQPLKVVATGLSSEKPVVLSHDGGHFDTFENLCNSLHASCLLPGIAGPVMNVLKSIRGQKSSEKSKKKFARTTDPEESKTTSQGSIGDSSEILEHHHEKPKFFLRNTHRERHRNDKDYEPLGDAMLSAPIPYDIAHDDGATHVLVIRSSPDGTNLLKIPSIMAWIGSKIYKRYFLKKNYLPGMYKRSQMEQRHQRVYAKTILELNERTNYPPPSDSGEHQTMTIALEPGSDEVSHLETTREGIFKGVRQGFARAYDALVEDPAMRGKGKEMALIYFPDEILDYDPNDARLSSSRPPSKKKSKFRSAFEEYLSSTGVVPKTWVKQGNDHKRFPMP